MLGEKVYQVPWFSMKSKQPEFVEFMSTTFPVGNSLPLYAPAGFK